ncbi:unnamed protein product [Rotaria sp. Silwood2]|nr:unnamed protein product [Rotaria sp. Silwood2]
MSPKDTNLPTIVILATGGIIAGVSNMNEPSDSYDAGVLTVKELLKSVPNIGNIARIQTKQLTNIDSKDMTIEIWKKLVKNIHELLKQPSIDGIVVTHGTDTLEETSFFTQLIVNSDKPVVFTAAMRPSTALSADGPLNLFNAVVVAASQNSRGQGVLVVMNGKIFSAYDVTKTNTYCVDTFCSPEFGPLGRIENSQAHYQRSMRNTNSNVTSRRFDINTLSNLPRVKIVPSYAQPS